MNAPVTSAPGMNKQWVERRAKAVSRGVGMGAAGDGGAGREFRNLGY